MPSYNDMNRSDGELTDRAFNGDPGAQRTLNYRQQQFDTPQAQSQNPSYQTGGGGQTHQAPSTRARLRALLVWGAVVLVLYRTGWVAHALTDQAAFGKAAGTVVAGAFVTSRYLRQMILGCGLLLGLLFVAFNLFMYFTTGHMPGLLKPAPIPPAHSGPAK